jgi:hypothetical protein
MKIQLPTPQEEAHFVFHFEVECERKEKLMTAFEEMERRERKRKKPNLTIFQKKYERVRKGLFFVEKINGDFIHLVDGNDKKLGMLHVTPEINKLIKVNDGLEGAFGFRDSCWRVQFLFSIESSTSDFMPSDN